MPVLIESLDSEDEGEDKLGSNELRAMPPVASKRASESASSSGLSQHWKRTKTIARGAEMIPGIAYLFDAADPKKNSDRVGFLQVLLVGPQKPKPQRKPKVQRKKEGEENFNFSASSQEFRQGLPKPRRTAWQHL